MFTPPKPRHEVKRRMPVLCWRRRLKRPGKKSCSNCKAGSACKTGWPLFKEVLECVGVILDLELFTGTPLKMNGWNLKITQLKRKIIFQSSILKFQVNFPGCMFYDFLMVLSSIPRLPQSSLQQIMLGKICWGTCFQKS